MQFVNFILEKLSKPIFKQQAEIGEMFNDGINFTMMYRVMLLIYPLLNGFLDDSMSSIQVSFS